MSAAPHARKPKPHPNPASCAAVLTALLHEHQPTLVMLQETDPAILALATNAAYELHRGPLGLTTLTLRQAYRAAGSYDLRQRAQAVVLRSTRRGEVGLLLFNVHIPVLFKTEKERGEFIRLQLLPEMNRLRAKYPAYLEITAGDFNLPPYDEVIVAESGLFANRDAAHMARQGGTVNRAVYNASWSIFGGSSGALGTYRRASLPHGPWQVPDQVLLDPRLLPNKQVSVRVLTKTVAGLDLHTPLPYGYPSKTVASDHFPTLVTLSVQPAAAPVAHP